MLLDVAFENRAISENQTRFLAKQREIETALSIRGGKQLFKKKNTAKSDDDDGEQEPELPDFPLKYDEDFTSFKKLEKDISEKSAFRSNLVNIITMY